MIKTSRLETGVISLEQKQQPVYDTLAAALGGILLNAEKKQIDVQVECPEHLDARHDRKWTSEALFNILDNAVKYTPTGGQIRVSVEGWEMYVKINIADTGIGISEQHQGTIFKRFYREDAVHDVDGIGIGLYLAREIVTLQGGYIRVASEVGKYCEKWLLMQSVHVRATTMTDYTSKVRRHIIKELGDMRMADVTLDDIQIALVPVSQKSASVYKSVVVLYKSIFRAAKESRVIDKNPTVYLTSKGGGVPQKEKEALTDEQAARLLDAIQGLPPYVFVMLGLYAGLRREEILALQWDSVYLDTDTPYLTVRRAWHTESNRPVILDELKTKAAERNIPLPICLADCLKEAKANSTSEYVVPNRDGDPLSYTQFKRLWQYIVTRTVKERSYYRYEDGKRVRHTVTPVLGEKAAHNGKVVYSLDFEVTPHQLRHTYITNLIHSSVDPKTVQYLAGHESSKITMDIYAKVKYNRPDELVKSMGGAFAQWDGVRS
ncbi:tyrosine-type recombinase/integrase [Gemmiger formicilis]|uniref:tyrosine-type recombinase/integrase n=1 Tax=Gemmiger formicilis TaxID=745368 RepID=UPI0039939938